MKTPSFNPDRYARAGKMLGYVLTLGTAEAWGDLAFVLVARLDAQARRSLACAALAAVDPADVEAVVTAALTAAGKPIVPFLSFADEAAFWADLASETELKVYAAACFHGLNSKNKTAFREYTARAV